MIKSYDETTDTLIFECQCTNIITNDCTNYVCTSCTDDLFKFECSECGDVIFLNMNIPIGAYDEYELEQTVMTPEVIAERRALRDFMWAKRQDLQELDRAAVDQESYNKNVPAGE